MRSARLCCAIGRAFRAGLIGMLVGGSADDEAANHSGAWSAPASRDAAKWADDGPSGLIDAQGVWTASLTGGGASLYNAKSSGS